MLKVLENAGFSFKELELLPGKGLAKLENLDDDGRSRVQVLGQESASTRFVAQRLFQAVMAE